MSLADHAVELALSNGWDEGPRWVPTRVQRRIMRRIRDEGLLLLAECNLECWLFDVDHAPGGTYEERYRPVERVSNITAERLVLRGFVHGSGGLTRYGRGFLPAEDADGARGREVAG